MIIAAIDPSLTSSGLAILADGRPAALRRITSTKPAKNYAQRSDRLVAQSRAVMEAITDATDTYGLADIAVIEGMAFAHSNAFTSDGNGLWWVLYSILRARRIPIVVVAPKTRALWATGDGNADKKAVLAAVKALYPGVHIANHDVGDALAMALMAGVHYGEPVPFAVRPCHHVRMEAVKWPSNLCAKPDTTQVGAVQ